VLELNHPTITGLHVCNVLLAVFGMVDDLSAINGKLVLPIAVPIRFMPLPRIAMPTPFVSPVPDANFSALSNRGSSAEWTLA